jgi:hypothetical protein
MSTLKPNSVNKSVTFYSPLEDQDETMVRTGTLGPIIHSILHACSKEYVAKNNDNRKQYAKDLLKSILDEKGWVKTNEGKKLTHDNIVEIVEGFYEYVNDDESPDSKIVKKVIKKLNATEKISVYRLITELIPVNEMLKIDNIINFLNNTGEMQKLPQEKSNFIRDIVQDFINITTKVATHNAFKSYRENINISDPEVITLLSQYFECDIYIINDKDRIPYHLEGNGDQKSIIILSIAKDYEIVGRLLPGNKIQREYETNDKLIKKIRMFLNDPETIKKEYPELSPYIKSQISKTDDSDPESGPDSDPDSDTN